MSDATKPPSFFPRASNASVLTTFIAIVGCMLAFALVVYIAYLPNRGGPPTVDLSKVPEDQKWRYDHQSRVEHLLQLRANEADKLTHYSWVDQSAGVVRLPVERAMQLIVQEQNGGKN